MIEHPSRIPIVSVVIPTHNRKTLLLDAVASCLNQNWENLDVIIVDDGSNDGTANLASGRLGASWPSNRIRYVTQPNRGASSARNHGLRLARGDYVQFLDSDDLLMPPKIAKQIAFLEAPENDEAACCYCYGTMGVVEQDSTSVPATRIGCAANDPKELVRELCSRVVHGMQTSAPLWRRSHLMDHAGWREDISLGDDLEYHIRLLADAKKICFIEEELFFVREHPGSRLSADQMSASSLGSLIKTRRAIFETLQQSGLWDAQTQHAFLGAMRTIYANALQLGDHETIRDLENWLWMLASTPEQVPAFKVLILLRRMLGRHSLLGAHRLVTKLRPQ
jgi:glycosyltransferase involved in cell wall biosynthesis